MKKLKMLFALAMVCTTGYFSYNAYKITVMSETWLPGYIMEGIHAYVGTDINNNIEFVSSTLPSY